MAHDQTINQSKIILFVGDIGPETATAATRLDPAAKIITQQNYQTLCPGVFYTSLGDFDSQDTYISVLSQAHQLVFVEPNAWSDTKNNHSYMEYYTKKSLGYFKGRKHIVMDCRPNDWNTMLAVADVRRNNAPQLWIAGCSISHGVGVDEHQRYGNILSTRLNLPASFLTRSGTSIQWAADQILRSCIQSDDIVIWGLTSHRRCTYFDNSIRHVFPRYYEANPEFDRVISMDRLDDHNMIYQALTHIHQVINFCNQVGAKLQIVSLLADDTFLPYVSNLPNTINLSSVYEFLPWPDLGTDMIHPGPKAHQWFADEITKCI
jgi:hypothetical protein